MIQYNDIKMGTYNISFKKRTNTLINDGNYFIL